MKPIPKIWILKSHKCNWISNEWNLISQPFILLLLMLIYSYKYIQVALLCRVGRINSLWILKIRTIFAWWVTMQLLSPSSDWLILEIWRIRNAYLQSGASGAPPEPQIRGTHGALNYYYYLSFLFVSQMGAGGPLKRRRSTTPPEGEGNSAEGVCFASDTERCIYIYHYN